MPVGKRATMEACVREFDALCEEANTEDVPESAFAERLVEVANSVAAFRHQILVSTLAKQAARTKHPSDAVMRLVRAYVRNKPITVLADIVKWSDSVRAQQDTGKPGRHFWGVSVSDYQRLKTLARDLLEDDVTLCVATHGF